MSHVAKWGHSGPGRGKSKLKSPKEGPPLAGWWTCLEAGVAGGGGWRGWLRGDGEDEVREALGVRERWAGRGGLAGSRGDVDFPSE